MGREGTGIMARVNFSGRHQRGRSDASSLSRLKRQGVPTAGGMSNFKCGCFYSLGARERLHSIEYRYLQPDIRYTVREHLPRGSIDDARAGDAGQAGSLISLRHYG